VNGAVATVPLQARKGRASYLGTRSVGHEDPGAASTVLLMRALADVASDTPGTHGEGQHREAEHGEGER
jgi:dihydroxyacetone kinase-like protein